MRKDDFEYLLSLLKQNAGWEFDDDKFFIVDKKMYNIVREKGYTTVEDLIADLKSGNKTLLWQVVESLAMSDTSFFRDCHVFTGFENHVIPYIRDLNRSTKKIRIWSVGCSTGQETYSIAMCIKNKSNMISDWSTNIIGTDISTQSIAKAQKGLYSQFEVQMGMNVRTIIDNFTLEKENWLVKKDLQSMVEFRRYNLLEELTFAEKFDVIFCRNVLRFFNPEQQRKILENIYTHQVTGGFLYLGLGERIEGLDDYYEVVKGLRCLYQPKKNISKTTRPSGESMPTFRRPDALGLNAPIGSNIVPKVTEAPTKHHE